MKRTMAMTAVILLLSPSITRAAAPDTTPASEVRSLVPSLGIGLGETSEQLNVAGRAEVRGLMETRVAIGLGVELWRPTGDLTLQGHSSIGVALVFHLGDWPLYLRQEFTFEYSPQPWFGLRFGLGTGVSIHSERMARSYWELGLTLGIRLSVVEVLYYPMLTVGLGSEDDKVFGGMRSLSAATTVEPLGLMLRFHFGSMGR